MDRVRFVILGTLVNCPPALLFEKKKLPRKVSRVGLVAHPRIRLGQMFEIFVGVRFQIAAFTHLGANASGYAT